MSNPDVVTLGNLADEALRNAMEHAEYIRKARRDFKDPKPEPQDHLHLIVLASQVEQLQDELMSMKEEHKAEQYRMANEVAIAQLKTEDKENG